MPDNNAYLDQLRRAMNQKNAQPRTPAAAPPPPPPPPRPRGTPDWALDEDGQPRRVLRAYPNGDEVTEEAGDRTREGNEMIRHRLASEDVQHTPMDSDVDQTRRLATPDASYSARGGHDIYRSLPEAPESFGIHTPVQLGEFGEKEGGGGITARYAPDYRFDIVAERPPAIPPGRGDAPPPSARDQNVTTTAPTRERLEAAHAATSSLGLPLPPPSDEELARRRAAAGAGAQSSVPPDWLRFGR